MKSVALGGREAIGHIRAQGWSKRELELACASAQWASAVAPRA